MKVYLFCREQTQSLLYSNNNNMSRRRSSKNISQQQQQQDAMSLLEDRATHDSTLKRAIQKLQKHQVQRLKEIDDMAARHVLFLTGPLLDTDQFSGFGLERDLTAETLSKEQAALKALALFHGLSYDEHDLATLWPHCFIFPCSLGQQQSISRAFLQHFVDHDDKIIVIFGAAAEKLYQDVKDGKKVAKKRRSPLILKHLNYSLKCEQFSITYGSNVFGYCNDFLCSIGKWASFKYNDSARDDGWSTGRKPLE